MQARDTRSGHSSGPVLWCIYGIQPGPFYRLLTSHVKPCLSSLCLFMIHAGGGALLFYRPWLWPKQACIDSTHAACVVGECIWSVLDPIGIQINPQKQRTIGEECRAAGCKQRIQAAVTAVALFYGRCRDPAAALFYTFEKYVYKERTLKQVWSNIHMVWNRSYGKNMQKQSGVKRK